MSVRDVDELAMLDLFHIEAETQAHVLMAGLLALERDHGSSAQLEACMRAAHSLKGAAMIVGLAAGVRLAHAIEDVFVGAQQGRLALTQAYIDVLLRGADLLARVARTEEADPHRWESGNNADVDAWIASLTDVGTGAVTNAEPATARPSAEPAASDPSSDRTLRVTAENLNRLLSLAGESLVQSRWAKPFAGALEQLKRLHHELGSAVESLQGIGHGRAVDSPGQAALAGARRKLDVCEHVLAERIVELDLFERRSTSLAHRLYDEALACRMRPFADGVQGFPRMVRDLARSLGRQVTLEIVGASTQVDRDILAKLDAPLGHLLRNAIDHGVEPADVRRAAGKSADAVVRIEARHNAGVLQIVVEDDGGGIDIDTLRDAVVTRRLTTREGAAALSNAELMEFLFLPGFTLKSTLTEVSGRGVGLDVVQDMVKQVRGTVRVSTERGRGTRFQLQLPVTLSVVRTLLAEIGREPYAFPLASIVRTLLVVKDQVETLEGRQHCNFDGRRIGLVTARQVLQIDAAVESHADLAVIVMGDHQRLYGLVVDRFLGERELVVQPLDGQLGKTKDIAAGALMEDGSPVLIVDPDDLLRSIEKIVSAGTLASVPRGLITLEKKRKRILVVDDSLTVRELERKLLDGGGYEVEVAVDGMDGWNAVRTGHFNLVVSDIDMPRMDGIELVTRITRDPNLKSVPVMIVSYKDRDEDRQRGLEAGAAYYLTKGSFHDETLLQAVIDLIGAPDV